MHTVTSPGLLVRDALALPSDDAPLLARAAREERYPIHVIAGDTRERPLADLLDGVRAVAVISDATVDALYGAGLRRELGGHGVEVLTRTIPPGEVSKSLDRAVELWHWLAASELGRRDLVLCFGGGVICDLGGWVASAYMRGVPYANLPTTLLAMVDGALGGKVAVNHATAKNLIGAFQQPAAVLCDLRHLRSQTPRQLAAGLAECVKKGVIASPDYFAFVERDVEAIVGGDPRALARLVRAAAAIKTALVERDPYERDLRRPLNFGHALAHSLETVTGYGPLLHGEAVAFGMVAEARIAARRGWLADGLLERLIGVLDRGGLPTRAAALPAGVTTAALLDALRKVRLIRGGSLRWVLPVALGETVIADDVGEAEVRAALADCGLVV